MITQAILLAAGRGARLRPLTDHTPKPLITVGKQSLIEHNISRLQQAGITDIVINVCYLGDQIQAHLGDGSQLGVSIRYSTEYDGVLGTGGGAYRAMSQLDHHPFILMSSDIWSDYPLEQLTLAHDAVAHLVMVPNPDFHPTGDFGIEDNGRITKHTTQQYTYANIALIHPQLFQHATSHAFELTDVLYPAIAQQQITGSLYSGAWFNVGTPAELERLKQCL